MTLFSSGKKKWKGIPSYFFYRLLFFFFFFHFLMKSNFYKSLFERSNERRTRKFNKIAEVVRRKPPKYANFFRLLVLIIHACVYFHFLQVLCVQSRFMNMPNIVDIPALGQKVRNAAYIKTKQNFQTKAIQKSRNHIVVSQINLYYRLLFEMGWFFALRIRTNFLEKDIDRDTFEIRIESRFQLD